MNNDEALLKNMKLISYYIHLNRYSIIWYLLCFKVVLAAVSRGIEPLKILIVVPSDLSLIGFSGILNGSLEAFKENQTLTALNLEGEPGLSITPLSPSGCDKWSNL